MSETACFSVVIRAYTEARWDNLVAAIDSLRHQSLPPNEIVITVDHNPHLYSRVRAQFPDIEVVSNTYTKGSGNWNSGINSSHNELIAFLDDDATAAPDWIERLSVGFARSDVIAVGGSIEPEWSVGRPRWFPDEFAWVIGCSYLGLPESLTPVRNLIGCNMAVRRGAVEAVGGFREGIGHVGHQPNGCEETELFIRLHKHFPQQLILYDPSARVRHMVTPGRTTFRYFCLRCFLEGRSKALLTMLLGANTSLASERAHIWKTLPKGLLRNLAEVALYQDFAGFFRAIIIVTGLAITFIGFVSGLIFLNLINREMLSAKGIALPDPPHS